MHCPAPPVVLLITEHCALVMLFPAVVITEHASWVVCCPCFRFVWLITEQLTVEPFVTPSVLHWFISASIGSFQPEAVGVPTRLIRVMGCAGVKYVQQIIQNIFVALLSRHSSRLVEFLMLAPSWSPRRGGLRR